MVALLKTTPTSTPDSCHCWLQTMLTPSNSSPSLHPSSSVDLATIHQTPPPVLKTHLPPPSSSRRGKSLCPVISAANCPVGTLSPSSESDVGVGEEFVTSTSIKRDKENMHGAHRGTDDGGGMARGGAWSPSIVQTSGGTRRHFLRETNDVSSGFLICV